MSCLHREKALMYLEGLKVRAKAEVTAGVTLKVAAGAFQDAEIISADEAQDFTHFAIHLNDPPSTGSRRKP